MRIIFLLTKVVAFLIVTGAGASAIAGERSLCDGTVDLRKRGAPMEHLVPVSQGYGSTNLCGFFAFTAYLDTYRVAKREEPGPGLVRANAVSIGVENAVRRDYPYWFPLQNSTDPLALRGGRWGSTFCSLARAVREMGYCTDPSLPSGTPDETAKLSDITTLVYGKLLEIAETEPGARAAAIDQAMPEIYGRYLEWGSERRSRPNGALVLLAQSTVRKFVEAHVVRPYETIRKIFFSECADPFRRNTDFEFQSCEGEFYAGLDVTGLSSRERDPLRTARAGARIHALLSEKSPMPVPFAYCSDVLFSGKGYEGRSPVGQCGLHWSLIAGRKKIRDECYLLVRNSWNPEDEANYAKDWIVDRGDIWVREQELTRSMLVVQWLEY